MAKETVKTGGTITLDPFQTITAIEMAPAVPTMFGFRVERDPTNNRILGAVAWVPGNETSNPAYYLKVYKNGSLIATCETFYDPFEYHSGNFDSDDLTAYYTGASAPSTCNNTQSAPGGWTEYGKRLLVNSAIVPNPPGPAIILDTSENPFDSGIDRLDVYDVFAEEPVYRLQTGTTGVACSLTSTYRDVYRA